MLKLQFSKDDRTPLRVLALGAHCDDIEIGAGGTLLEWIGADRPVAVDWVVMTSTPERAAEATASAEAFLTGAYESRIVIHEFRDAFLPYVALEVKEAFEALSTTVAPDVILTHYRQDLHQDHRLVSELTWNTFRNHLILEYEIPKYDGDLGRPNCFVPVSEANLSRKVSHLFTHYATQAGKQWFREDTFRSLMRLRGIEANSGSGFAEGFHSPKVVL